MNQTPLGIDCMSKRMRLRPAVRYAMLPNKTILIENGPSLFKVLGEEAPALVDSILSLSDGTHTLEEIKAKCSLAASGDVGSVIEDLIRDGYIELIEKITNEDSRYYSIEDNIICNLGILSWQERSEVAKRLGSVAIALVVESGLNIPVGQTLKLSQLNVTTFGGVNTWAGGSVPKELIQYDVVVAVSESLCSPELSVLNQWCLINNRPFLPTGLLRRKQAFVGPWVQKGKGACHNCFILRIRMNNPVLLNHLQLAGSLIGCPQTTTGSSNLAVDTIIAGLITIELARKMSINSENNLSNRIQLIDLSDFHESITSHHLLPVPKCPACHTYRSRRHFICEGKGVFIERAVDSLVGIVRTVSQQHLDLKGPRVFCDTSYAVDISILNSQQSSFNNGGAGYNSADSFRAAVGESLERYAACVVEDDRLLFGNWIGLDTSIGHPNQYELFSDEQYKSRGFPFKPFTEKTCIRWIEGISWHSKTSVWIPASMVYLPYSPAKGEASITPCISTGLAAGSSIEAAVLNGLYEVVERDAFSITWLTNIPPIRVENLTAYFPEFEYFFPLEGYRYYLYELTLDISLRTVIAVMEAPSSDGTILTVGGATRRRLGDAIRKALLEAAQGQPYIKALLRLYSDWHYGQEFSNVGNFQQHAVIYSKYPELRGNAFLIGNREEEVYRSRGEGMPSESEMQLADELEYVVSVLRESGYEVLVADLTTCDLREIGVHVVRVIIPGLHGLHGNHRFKFLGGKRLRDMPRRFNCPADFINRFPHPYP